MKLERASQEAVRFAVEHYHYSHNCSSALTGVSYSVFNDKNEFCGVISYAKGANPNYGKRYNLAQGEVMELVRVALNGKQESTSKAVSISIKLLKKDRPMLKLLISYADKAQNHFGTIYQATNWYFIEESKSSTEEFLINGKWRHSRIVGSLNIRRDTIPRRRGSGKYKYVYAFTPELKELFEKLKKPYPKRDAPVV